MINHDASHQLRGNGEKMWSVLPARMCLVDKLKIRLVDEHGGLQGVPLSFAAHIIVRQPMQFGLHQRNQLIERARVSAAPVHSKLSDGLLHRRGRRHTKIILMRWIGRVETALS
jgi:hypothetical protein